MCDPSEEIVLEPAFALGQRGDESIGFTKAVFCSNCDQLKIFSRPAGTKDWKPLTELAPDRGEFAHLKYPPFVLDLHKVRVTWGDLRIDGYLGGKQVISKSLSGAGVDRKFALQADDATLLADGADTTRIVLRVTDEFGATRTYADDPIQFTLTGPAKLIGDNPFSLVGGTGAVWVRATEQPGTVTLKARHPRLGEQTITIATTRTPAELA